MTANYQSFEGTDRALKYTSRITPLSNCDHKCNRCADKTALLIFGETAKPGEKLIRLSDSLESKVDLLQDVLVALAVK